MLHDAEDVVHPLELALFDQLMIAPVLFTARAAADRPGFAVDQRTLLREFAEAHSKRWSCAKRSGGSIPLAARCAIAREPSQDCRDARRSAVRRRQHDRGLRTWMRLERSG